jgi:hypothetical protein
MMSDFTMLPDAELQGFRLLVVAMVISGNNFASLLLLDHRYASDAQLLRRTSIIFLRKVTEEVTP